MVRQSRANRRHHGRVELARDAGDVAVLGVAQRPAQPIDKRVDRRGIADVDRDWRAGSAEHERDIARGTETRVAFDGQRIERTVRDELHQHRVGWQRRLHRRDGDGQRLRAVLAALLTERRLELLLPSSRALATACSNSASGVRPGPRNTSLASSPRDAGQLIQCRPTFRCQTLAHRLQRAAHGVEHPPFPPQHRRQCQPGGAFVDRRRAAVERDRDVGPFSERLHVSKLLRLRAAGQHQRQVVLADLGGLGLQTQRIAATDQSGRRRWPGW